MKPPFVISDIMRLPQMRQKRSKTKRRDTAKQLADGAQRVLQEPIMKALLNQSTLTKVQLETLLIDLVVEDEHGSHIPYDEKASFRSKRKGRTSGVSRGAFNRTLGQARRNVPIRSATPRSGSGGWPQCWRAIWRSTPNSPSRSGTTRAGRPIRPGSTRKTS